MGTVVVLGSFITDLVARASRMPLPGETLFGEDFTTFLGGKGINQAIAAARLGAIASLPTSAEVEELLAQDKQQTK